MFKQSVIQLLSVILTCSLLTSEPVHANEPSSLQIQHMLEIAPEPEVVDYEEDLKTVIGVDSNNDGTRDSLHHLAWSLFILHPESTKADYVKVLALMKYMHPKEPIGLNSIDMNKVYCDYLDLPQFIHAETENFKNFYHLIIDSDRRQAAFAKSLIKQKEQPQAFCPSLWSSNSRKLLGLSETNTSK
ncbi:hypothetical protein AB4455_10495 [Vibrio sp. 10N.261.46.E12]|uniref:hypothetical protein n=1 Tax=unclassified Vibrio TaxID=2614977 RepID=UPI000978171C|nr:MULTISPECIES: hypothetical protein [unclassified Vibrio]OMO36103.1 hypothetical protein BH584_04835 [Vibrio sp. 10N.261.45.E1]PMJ34545.1 hypothetical protein BCU27_03700 [Vibrio sp. 10N.286.45.B6]PML88073.1 hypothetical protein BCT66_10770 [Vibrio sp. 10N.261.49.E11]PMM67401.1 hypothetical protein BCT48_15245 [Vibrio sp. 10N.261.46.F12]PMM81716.1 hypothetical protein BCT46_15015 [Vibrio sp. 10N.261.46.E8]